MRNTYWVRIRAARLLVILLAVTLYICLVAVDGMHDFPHALTYNAASGLSWAIFGFSAFVALMFLAIGSLVWIYALDRGLALLLFGFSCSMMVSFAVQSGASLDDIVLARIGGVATTLSLLLLAILLLLFPENLFLQAPSSEIAPGNHKSLQGQRRRNDYHPLLRFYVGILIVLAGISVVYNIFYTILPSQILVVFHTIASLYAIITLTGIIVTIIVSYRRTSSERKRQQRRIFVGGVILATAPLLLLTVIPEILIQTIGLSSNLMIDPQLSTLTIALFPIALGYSILRYQILVFDMYIRRAVVWLFGCLSLVVGSYFVLTLSGVIFAQRASQQTVFVLIAMVVLAPCIWWLAKILTELLFFSEISRYERLVKRTADMFSDRELNLDEIARLLALAMISAFQTQEVCLFVLDAETGYFRLVLPPEEDDPNGTTRNLLAQRLLQKVEASVDTPLDQSSWIKSDDTLIKCLAATRRPLFLHEASLLEDEMPTGIGRYLIGGDMLDGGEPLLVPMKVQGKMIGILLLGERGDRQQYAGPDFEAIYIMLARFAPILETARLYEQENRHIATLRALYSATATLEKAYHAIEEVAEAYATIAAEAVRGGAEVWLYDEINSSLQYVVHVGPGPRLTYLKSLTSVQESVWSSWFYGNNKLFSLENRLDTVLSCLPEIPQFPFVWLPLSKGAQHFGVLVLTYSNQHLFSREEQRVLELFASQFASAIENAQYTIALRFAYEKSKQELRIAHERSEERLRAMQTGYAGSSKAEPRAIKIFISYARKDKKLREELVKHLTPLIRSGQISMWYDYEIQPGDEWKQMIDEHLNNADIVLLLVTPNFIHSNYCYQVEMPKALERHKAGETRVIPIILRPIFLKETTIGELQVLPRNGKSVYEWRNRDEAYRDVAEGIHGVIEALLSQSHRDQSRNEGHSDYEEKNSETPVK